MKKDGFYKIDNNKTYWLSMSNNNWLGGYARQGGFSMI